MCIIQNKYTVYHPQPHNLSWQSHKLKIFLFKVLSISQISHVLDVIKYDVKSKIHVRMSAMFKSVPTCLLFNGLVVFNKEIKVRRLRLGPLSTVATTPRSLFCSVEKTISVEKFNIQCHLY